MAPAVRKIVSLPQDTTKAKQGGAFKELAKRQIAMFIVSPRDLRFLTGALARLTLRHAWRCFCTVNQDPPEHRCQKPVAWCDHLVPCRLNLKGSPLFHRTGRWCP